MNNIIISAKAKYLVTKILVSLNTWKSKFMTSLNSVKDKLVETEKKW